MICCLRRVVVIVFLIGVLVMQACGGVAGDKPPGVAMLESHGWALHHNELGGWGVGWMRRDSPPQSDLETIAESKEIVGITFSSFMDTEVAEVVFRCHHLQGIVLEGGVSAEALNRLSNGVADLRLLSITGAVLVDMDEGALGRFSNIEKLYLHDSEVSQNNLKSIGSLSRLEVLSLKGTNIDDSVIDIVASSRGLVFLDLSYCDVSVDGLYRLASLPHLRTVVITRTKVTDRDLEQLQKTMPDVSFVR